MEPMIALRGSFRWVQCFEPVQPGTPGRQRLRDRGVYLISGGLGHIGSILAKYLAQTVNARLILTGRSPMLPGEEWERKKQEIEALGGEVLVLTADAGDREQIQTAITRAEERFGPLNGVIHAAGVISGPSIRGIQDLRPMDCQEQFRPKVEGLEILNSLLQGKNLDFCFLVSSLSSILGGLGFTAYSAANLFMDAFTQKANRENPIPWISVNWDTWQSKADTLPTLPASPGEGITPEEGVRAFHQVLSHRFATRMVVSTRDLSARINRWIKRQYLHESDILARSRALDQDMVSFNQTERSIAQLCRHFFGIKHVGSRDHFFDDMGAASLDIIRLNRKLKEILNRDIPVERWFEYPTIASLAEYLDSSAPTPEPMRPTERSSPRAEKAFKLTRRKKHD
jgi:NADP-dependent 3-hydroxy acid dehydrogenase YdfG/acyl carrier protein